MDRDGWPTSGESRESPPPETDSLSVQFRRGDLGRHLACFYDSPEHQLRVAATFVRVGLESGSRCLYFFDANTRSAVETALRAAGIDVDARIEAGDLLIREGSDAYRAAEFDPSRLITLLEEACHDSVTDGYDGLWIAGEVSWCFHTDLDYDHVVDFEAEFDAVCPDMSVTSLCQYDLTQFNEESIAKALWTHERFVYRDTVCENPFYIPPSEYQSAAERPVNTRLMLEQAYRLAEATEAVERREQRLAVVDRVLRHDVRNHLNVARGTLDLLREAGAVDGDRAEQLTAATDSIDTVIETATKARVVQRTLDASRVERTSLRPVVDSAVERVVSGRPDAEIVVDENAGDHVVVADATLDVALAELLLYALRAQDDPGRVSVHIADYSPDTVRLDVSYPGPPVPTNDRRVLQDGLETPLSHCTGLGLWLVKWIVENGGGDVDFPADAEAPIRLLFERADRRE